jgi:hypothetical protein
LKANKLAPPAGNIAAIVKLVGAAFSGLHDIVVHADHFKKSIDGLGQEQLGHVGKKAENPPLIVQILVDIVQGRKIAPIVVKPILKVFKI